MSLARTLRERWRRIHASTSLGFKLFAPLALLVVLAAAGLAALGYRAQRAALTAQYAERARGAAAVLDHEVGVLGFDVTDVDRVHRHVSHLLVRYPEIVRVTLYARSGDAFPRVYSSDGTAGGPVGSHDVEPLRTGRASVHELTDGGRRLLEVVLPLRRDGRVVAAVGIYASLEERDRRLQVFIRWAALTTAATLAILVGLLYLTARVTVVAPLHRALARAERLGVGGHLPGSQAGAADLPGPVRDEVQRFERALDAVMDRVLRDRAQIRQLAVTDPLTGLYNRHFFHEIVRREVVQAERYGQPFALAVVDVNGLREVNNRYGHLAGDELLRQAARFLRTHVRAADEVIRWGGDEFLILMPRTDEAQAGAVARRLLDALDRPADGAPSLALSIGVAAWRPGHTVEDVLREADRHMYRHKSEARQLRPLSGRRIRG